MKSNIILTLKQAADIFSVSENTLAALAYCGHIPHIKLASTNVSQLCFNSNELVNWFNNLTPIINHDKNPQYFNIKKMVSKSPEKLTILKKFDKQFTDKKIPKGYSLQKVKNKKLGFCYYVRFIDKGIITPRYSTHTNNFEFATQFAIEKREEILAKYNSNITKKYKYYKLYTVMKNFYDKDSKYMEFDNRRSKPLGEKARQIYNGAIKNYWIPFLKSCRITEFDSINTGVISDFQDYCIKKDISPQSTNQFVSYVSRIYKYLIIKKIAKSNPCKDVTPLNVKDDNIKIRGCYKTDELCGIFMKRWNDEIYNLLCMVIYSTGMRNSEIEKMKVNDIIKIRNCFFINIPISKSKHGIRIVPLHGYVYEKLMRYVKKNNKKSDDLLFTGPDNKTIPQNWFKTANITLGKFTKHNEGQLKKENITFYSGRHWYKTTMNAYDLGDIEEYFMGHKVTRDVEERYNHRDKQGQAILIKKAGEVFQILDKTLFNKPKQAKKQKKDKAAIRKPVSNKRASVKPSGRKSAA